MFKGAKIEGAERLRRTLTRFGNKARRDTAYSVEVGFDESEAPYAIIVHELTGMKLRGKPRPSGIGVYWGPRGEAKFLEKSVVALRGQIAKRIANVTKNTGSIKRGLYSGGVLLREAVLKIVPVEYGVLRDSIYIEITFLK